MNRTSLLQCLLDRRREPAYLEIGVSDGRNFLEIRAPRKFAVDPVFRISARKKLGAMLTNRTNLRNRYFEVASDEFFARHAHDLPAPGVDVVLIDGLHTYAQALADTEHSLARLKPDGVIVLHDCNPPHAAAATPATSVSDARSKAVVGWDNRWCGDVWKAIVHLRSTRADLSVAVIDCDMGLGVVRRAANAELLPLMPEEISRFDYGDLEHNRKEWLDLRPETSIGDFL